MLLIGNQMQKSWAIEPIRLQVIRRIQSNSFPWPDHDLRLFLFLIFEKLLRRAYELNKQPTDKAPVQAMMRLHLNELGTIEHEDRVHLIELLRRWAGNQWEEPKLKGELPIPTNWADCVRSRKISSGLSFIGCLFRFLRMFFFFFFFW